VKKTCCAYLIHSNYGIINLHHKQEEQVLKSLEVARKAVEAASDKLADNIIVLDIRKICSFADYFVICSADSDRQIEAIREEVTKTLKHQGLIPHHTEGTADSGWLLIDLGDVIVHIFSRQQRDHYKLDELWNEATPLVRIQ
jgi:ribosome-associated protein